LIISDTGFDFKFTLDTYIPQPWHWQTNLDSDQKQLAILVCHITNALVCNMYIITCQYD